MITTICLKFISFDLLFTLITYWLYFFCLSWNYSLTNHKHPPTTLLPETSHSSSITSCSDWPELHDPVKSYNLHCLSSTRMPKSARIINLTDSYTPALPFYLQVNWQSSWSIQSIFWRKVGRYWEKGGEWKDRIRNRKSKFCSKKYSKPKSISWYRLASISSW